jgi:nicotinate-nucleotide adenylyltransferase
MHPGEAAPARVGVLGGSFNPVHHAHLFTAETAAAAFGLDRVLLAPAATNPLKRSALATARDRAAMVRLAIDGNRRLALSTVDVDRPPPSYSVNTMRLVQAQFPRAEVFLVLGIDALVDLLDWHDPEGLLDVCQLIVVARPGYALEVPGAVRNRLGQRAARIHLQPMPLLEISSTMLRSRLAAGQPVRYLLPAAVEHYIRSRGLYGTRRQGAAGARRGVEESLLYSDLGSNGRTLT